MNITKDELGKMSVDELLEKAMGEVKDLPRHERRRYEKELKEHARIAKTFNPAQLKFIDKLVDEKSRLKINEEMNKYNSMMDRCISAFLTMEFEELTLEEIYKKEEFIGELIVEDLKKFDERMKEYKGDFKMANKKMDKYEEEIRVVCEELINNGATQKSAIVILQDKFPTLSKSMVVNAYKKVKEQVKEGATDACKSEIKKIDDEDIKEIAKAAAEYIFEENEEVKEEIKPQDSKPASKLKIKSMTVQGENGIYIVNENGIEGELEEGTYSFNNIESLNNYKQAQIEKITKVTDEFEAVFAMMQ